MYAQICEEKLSNTNRIRGPDSARHLLETRANPVLSLDSEETEDTFTIECIESGRWRKLTYQWPVFVSSVTV